MSLSDLISLKGLVTVTIGSVLSVKAMHITWNISRNHVQINGDNNKVAIIEELSRVRGSFKLLWGILSVSLFLTYPIFGDFYNSVLAAAAFFGIPLSVMAICDNHLWVWLGTRMGHTLRSWCERCLLARRLRGALPATCFRECKQAPNRPARFQGVRRWSSNSIQSGGSLFAGILYRRVRANGACLPIPIIRVSVVQFPGRAFL